MTERQEALLGRRTLRAVSDHPDETILVQIPSFRDPELFSTVCSALVQADVPDRVHFAVCYQDDDMATLARLGGIKHMSVARVRPEDAKGTCYARWLCQGLYGGEDFAFYTDSHMRFVRHWDTALLRQWHACGDPMAVVAFYPYSVPHADLEAKLDGPAFDAPRPGSRLGVKITDRDNWRVTFQQKVYRDWKDGPEIRDRSPFISGANTFLPGRASAEVRMDPNMWYQGDEFAYGIRLFTYGYNVYNAGRCYALHKYGRPERKVPPMNGRRAAEGRRLRTLMGISQEAELGEYGAGPVRTVAAYQAFSGIDFETRKLQERAVTGIYGLGWKEGL